MFIFTALYLYRKLYQPHFPFPPHLKVILSMNVLEKKKLTQILAQNSLRKINENHII